MDDRADWIRENLTTRHKWGINDFQEFYDRDVTYLLDQIAQLRAENERLKRCYQSSTGKAVCGEGSVVRVECDEMAKLRAELANITEPSRTPEYEHTTHHYACACREAEFAKWKDRAEELEDENRCLSSSVKNLHLAIKQFQGHLAEAHEKWAELESELASGLLLKRHSPDEDPQCPADIVGRTIIAELKNGMIVEVMWLKSKPNVVSRNGVDIPFSELKCWYANDGESL